MASLLSSPGRRLECQTCFYDTRFADVMADHLRDDGHSLCLSLATEGVTAARKARPGPASKTIRKGAELKNVQVSVSVTSGIFHVDSEQPRFLT